MVAGKFGEHEDFVWCQRLTEQVAFLDSALFHDGPFWVSVCAHVSGLCQLCFALLLRWQGHMQSEQNLEARTTCYLSV